MGYSRRIETLCSLLPKSKTFADVGCDHGYCSEYMLKNELCEQAIFSDISKGSLQKAETLLKDYVEEGRALPVLGNGFYGVPKDTELVLIAGMGGSEIVEILQDKKYGFMPEKFLFQPMHDSEKLRRYILANGGNILKDYTFKDEKFYDVIYGERLEAGGNARQYSDLDFEFGYDNLRLRPIAWQEKMQKLIDNTKKYLSQENLQEESRSNLENKLKKLTEVLGK